MRRSNVGGREAISGKLFDSGVQRVHDRLLPRQGVANASTEAVEQKHGDAHKCKLAKGVLHEYPDGMLNPMALL